MFTVGFSTRVTRREENLMTQATRNEVIIDSGATEHEVGDIQLLTDVKKVLSIHVELPDDQRMATTQ